MSAPNRALTLRAHAEARRGARNRISGARAVAVERSAAIVAEASGRPASAFLGRSQGYEDVRARHLTFWLCHRRDGLTMAQVAFGSGFTDGAVCRAIERVGAVIERRGLNVPDDPFAAAAILWTACWALVALRGDPGSAS